MLLWGLIAGLGLCILQFFFTAQSKMLHYINGVAIPSPTEGEENENLREKYNALRHKAAPGVNWQTVEAENLNINLAALKTRPLLIENEAFAGGALNGTWEERGANNQTGSIRAIDYVPQNNTLYTISNGGTLWSSVLGSGVWLVRNQANKFDGAAIAAFTKTGGGLRILAVKNQNIVYTDDEGASFISATGISYPIGWGGNTVVQIIKLNDATGSVYALVQAWDGAVGQPRGWLYRSTNQGASFVKIYTFESSEVRLCKPYNSSSLFAADITSNTSQIKFFSISGFVVTLANTFSHGTTVGNPLVLKGSTIGNTTTLYAMAGNNKLFKTTNNGATWSLTNGGFSENAWAKMNVSPSDAATVLYGGVNAYRSTNSGSSFTKINDWSEYYSNTVGKLHADIMELEYFKRPDNSEFLIINTHGGTYISTDNGLTVTNLSQLNHLATEYYDVLTDSLNPTRLYGGTQDQGLQQTLTATAAGTQGFKQIISGDYGHLSLTNNNQFLWPQYPGGTFYLYNNLGTASPSYIGYYQLPGTQKSNYGWMLPSKSTANAAANEIWIGGGNITGGGGSYLAKLSLPLTAPYTVSASQINYNFRAASNSGTAGITALEQSLINPQQLYVASEDGTFFYSSNGGSTWNKTATFSGPTPWYLYGSGILASRKNAKVIWYCGSGYSNAPVYKSTDGGVSFSPMNAGLPNTLVNEMVASPDESLLFAATEAGPYVYTEATNKWYPMLSNNLPISFFSSVEYISALNTVRFSTMGRGIWDFKISGTTYTFTGNGSWTEAANWQGNLIPPASLSYGNSILINPAGTGECVLNTPQTIAFGASITVNPGKKFRINGNLLLK